MIDVYVASAFSKDSCGGNKAGVVIHEGRLNRKEKMQIAAKLGYSETAFVSQSEETDFRLEYFTPTEEVPLCGHATIATFVILRYLNMLEKELYTIETSSGILNITADKNGLIFMDQTRPCYSDILDKKALQNCFETDCIDDHLPIQIVSTGLRDILVPIGSSTQLKNLLPSFENISDLSKDKNVIGIHAFSLVNTESLTAICRNFAPLYGIDEESATGTANCALACYLFKHGQKRDQYVFEQGHNLNNISRILVKVTSHEENIMKVAVGGYGYFVGKKSLTL